MTREENMYKSEFALMRFISVAICEGKDIPGLGEALVDYKRTFFEYQEYSKIFKSVPGSHALYNEAQFNAAICDFVSLLRQPQQYARREEAEARRIARSLESFCGGVAAKKTGEGEDTYRMLLRHSLMMMNSILNIWSDASNQVFIDVLRQQQNVLMRVKRLQNAGFSDTSSLKRMVNEAQVNLEFVHNLNGRLSHCFGILYEFLIIGLARNLRSPDTLGEEIFGMFMGYAKAIGEGEAYGVKPGLESRVKTILDKNREKLLEELYASPEYKESVKQYWGQHPSQKARLEEDLSATKSKTADISACLNELKQKQLQASSAANTEKKLVKEAIFTIKEDLEANEKQLGELGFFALARKRELKSHIEELRVSLKERESTLEEIERRIADEKKHSELEISRVTEELKNAQKQIDDISDRLAHPPAALEQLNSTTSDSRPLEQNPTQQSAAEADKCFDIILQDYGENIIGVIKVVREFTSLSLKKAKETVESAPTLIFENIKKG